MPQNSEYHFSERQVRHLGRQIRRQVGQSRNRLIIAGGEVYTLVLNSIPYPLL